MCATGAYVKAAEMTSNTSTRPFPANITRFSHLNQSDTANTAITKLIVDPTYRHQKRLEYMSPQTRGWPVVLHRNTNSQGQTWGVNCGSLPGVLLGAQTLGALRGAKLSRGCLCFKETESSQQCALWRHIICHPHATCKFTACSVDYI